jgi:hypothetical protein
VLNRKLNSQKSDDGYIPVTLHLPFENVTRITRYRLEQLNGMPVDPKANNLDDLKITIGSVEVDPRLFASKFVLNANTGGEAYGLPPGSINLFVFETDAPVSLDSTTGNDQIPDDTDGDNGYAVNGDWSFEDTDHGTELDEEPILNDIDDVQISDETDTYDERNTNNISIFEDTDHSTEIDEEPILSDIDDHQIPNDMDSDGPLSGCGNSNENSVDSGFDFKDWREMLPGCGL